MTGNIGLLQGPIVDDWRIHKNCANHLYDYLVWNIEPSLVGGISGPHSFNWIWSAVLFDTYIFDTGNVVDEDNT